MNIEKYIGPIRTLPATILGFLAASEAAEISNVSTPLVLVSGVAGGLAGALLEHAALTIADRRDNSDRI